MIRLTSKINPKLKACFVKVPPPLEENQYWGEKGWHIQRMAAHTASKMALALLENPLGETEPSIRFKKWFCQEAPDILLEPHYHLNLMTNKLSSRTHTNGLAGAVSMSSNKSALSIGVDLEAKKRSIPTALKRFMEHPRDQTAPLSELMIWCMKEACFKAVSSWLNFHQRVPKKQIVLTDLVLTKNAKTPYYDFSYISDEIKYLGRTEIQEVTFDKNIFYCAFALLEKESRLC